MTIISGRLPPLLNSGTDAALAARLLAEEPPTEQQRRVAPRQQGAGE
ncbi:hypothetical protein ACFVT2_34640 [Streptomyces sp. NPDC058000]